MENNTLKYIELAIGSVSNRAYAIQPEHITKYIKEDQELYRSLFLLDNTAFEHFRDKGSIKSYKGTYAIDKITFDIDKGKLIGTNLMHKVRSFVEHLSEQGVKDEWIHIWFSGRGFHIDVPNLYGLQESTELPYQAKLTIDKHFGNQVDNIYDKGRLIRVGYTVNMKSQLYKIPLSIDMLMEMDYDTICDYASSNKVGYHHKPFGEYNEIWKDYTEDTPKIKTEEKPVKTSEYNANVTCIQKMWDNDKDGRRHITLLRMINGWKRMGIPKEGAIKMAAHNVQSLDHNEILKIVDDVYAWDHNGYSCNDVIMAEFCDQICKFYKHKNYGMEVMNVSELSEQLKEFIHMDLDNNSFNLKNIYPLKTDYRFLPGELAILLGDTKLGKTAWLQNVIVKLKHLNILYLSLEVGAWLIFRRFLQVANSMTKQQIHDIYESGDELAIHQITDQVKNIKVMTVSPDIDSMKQIISDNQPQVVCIDTIDAIEVRYNNDPLNKMDVIVNSLKQIANQMDVIFIGISHISKGASYGPLTVHSAKGSSAIEQKADKIIGITGERESNNNRTIQSLASRDETDFKMTFSFDYRTFQFVPIGGSND